MLAKLADPGNRLWIGQLINITVRVAREII